MLLNAFYVYCCIELYLLMLNIIEAGKGRVFVHYIYSTVPVINVMKVYLVIVEFQY